MHRASILLLTEVDDTTGGIVRNLSQFLEAELTNGHTEKCNTKCSYLEQPWERAYLFISSTSIPLILTAKVKDSGKSISVVASCTGKSVLP